MHMNATQWETLTDFVKWLGREGYCLVDETEKGWYVAYVDRDPETIRRQEQLRRKEKFEKDEEERMQEFINKQIEIGQQKGAKEEATYSALQLDEEGKALSLSLNLNLKQASKTSALKVDRSSSTLSTLAGKKRANTLAGKDSKKDPKRPRTALDEIMEAEMHEKRMKEEVQEKRSKGDEVLHHQAERVARKDRPWLLRDIVVKIISKDFGSRYYKAKGRVSGVVNDYLAIVKLLECGTTLKVDQSKLETVIPSPERKVLILRGKFRGQEAILKKINEASFSASLQLVSGGKDRGPLDLPYEDFSKLCIS